jgi:hypothetical protein
LLYVNSVLYERDKAKASFDAVLATAQKAKEIGTQIIVTIPSPKAIRIRSGSTATTLDSI